MKIKYKPDRREDRVKLEVSQDGEDWMLLPPEQFVKWIPIHNWIVHSKLIGWWIYRVIFEEGKGFTYEVFDDFVEATTYYVAKCAKPTETRKVVQVGQNGPTKIQNIPVKFLLDAIKQLGELPKDPVELNNLIQPLLKLGYTQKELNEALEFIQNQEK